jgi:hypothetical protein
MGLRRRREIEPECASQSATTISVAAGEGGITEITVQASTPAVAFKLFKDVRSEVCNDKNKIKQCEVR